MTGFYNRDWVCLLRGTSWIFEKNRLIFVVKGLKRSSSKSTEEQRIQSDLQSITWPIKIDTKEIVEMKWLMLCFPNSFEAEYFGPNIAINHNNCNKGNAESVFSRQSLQCLWCVGLRAVHVWNIYVGGLFSFVFTYVKNEQEKIF